MPGCHRAQILQSGLTRIHRRFSLCRTEPCEVYPPALWVSLMLHRTIPNIRKYSDGTSCIVLFVHDGPDNKKRETTIL